MSLKAVDIAANTNHPEAEYLAGFSTVGTFTARLRRNTVTGQILYNIANGSSEVWPMSFRVDGGVYVEVVTGSITEGVLLYS
jgi:hypothetical protein